MKNTWHWAALPGDNYKTNQLFYMLRIKRKFLRWALVNSTLVNSALIGIACLHAATLSAQSPGHAYNGAYHGDNNTRLAFPIGGMGAGMFCLEGTGAISNMSVRNNPDVFNEPSMFAALSVKGIPNSARVLEGPVPGWKKFGQKGDGRGAEGTTFGLARFTGATFRARFPYAEIRLTDPHVPVAVTITGWSSFIPTDADNSSLPAGALEYRFTNTGSRTEDYVFTYNSKNFMALGEGRNSIGAIPGGYTLSQEALPGKPELKGDFAIFTDDPNTVVDHSWFRGGWWDPISMAWNNIRDNKIQAVAPVDSNAKGASLYVPFRLKPGASRTIRVMMAWYVPDTRLRFGRKPTLSSDSAVADASVNLPSLFHKPWYSSRFSSIKEVAAYWREHYAELDRNSRLFRDAFYKTTLPAEVTEAIAANLTILKSPTVLRQYDGRFWAWEGSNDTEGSCTGNCTHVWNYAQALSHLFPGMERSIRETEFNEDQDANGHQNYRAALPIRPAAHNYYEPAADGQLGGIMKVYREWRISGDSNWLRNIFPKVKTSLDYCIRTWDPRHTGTLEEPHHNTYDIEFWGPDGMCTGIYLGALEAMIKIGGYLHEDTAGYHGLYEKGKAFMEKDLFNGQYFYQQIKWTGYDAPDPVADPKKYLGEDYSPEAAQLLQKEGPKYQYGKGCLSDGAIGDWLAHECGLPDPFDREKIRSHLQSVYRNNFKKDLSDFSNPQRPAYALGDEGGLLLCTWPRGGKLSLPFVYSNEVWTGIEYEVASHLILMGQLKEGLAIVRTCRNRYDGRVRNPFDEYECGHWYARAMSSYALIEALTGARYDAVEKTLYIDSKVGDFTSFLSTATGFGNLTYRNGKATVHTVYGKIDIQKIVIGKSR
jgi:uncharacterized protein (DUF608 family)